MPKPKDKIIEFICWKDRVIMKGDFTGDTPPLRIKFNSIIQKILPELWNTYNSTDFKKWSDKTLKKQKILFTDADWAILLLDYLEEKYNKK